MRQKPSLSSRGTRQKVYPRSNSRDSRLGMEGGERKMNSHSLLLGWGTVWRMATSLTPLCTEIYGMPGPSCQDLKQHAKLECHRMCCLKVENVESSKRK